MVSEEEPDWTVLFATLPPAARGALHSQGSRVPGAPRSPALPETSVRRWVRSRGGSFRAGGAAAASPVTETPKGARPLGRSPRRVSGLGGRVGAR